MLVIDADAGVLDIEIDATEWAARPEAVPQHQAENEVGFGRELFGVFRAAAAPAELGASVFGPMVGERAAHHGEPAQAHTKAHGNAHTSTTQAS
jgi:phosphogluconate dehydratase